jgi:aminopeptidase N
VIRFRCPRPDLSTFVDVRTDDVRGLWLNGRALPVAHVWSNGRVALPGLIQHNQLVVETRSAYGSEDSGLRRVADAEREGVYSELSRAGASRVFACFDQPDLRAPFRLDVEAPAGWTCLSNTRATRRAPAGSGHWWFTATAPIAPYLLNLVAGTLSSRGAMCPRPNGSPVPIGVHTLGEPARNWLDVVKDLTRSLAFYGQELGVDYPFAKCDLAFVPGFGPLAFSAPGLMTLNEAALDSVFTRDDHRLLVLNHELAHAWLGGTIDIRRADDDWLFEALATYLARTATEHINSEAQPWATNPKQVPPDHGYAEDAQLIKNVEGVIGRRAVLDGLCLYLRRFAGACTDPDDLTECWSLAAGRRLAGWRDANRER